MTDRQPIASAEELEAYLAGDEIVCLECGRLFTALAHHIRRAHGLSSPAYRWKWGMPAMTPLAGQAYRARRADIVRDSVAAGQLTHTHLAEATEKARSAGRGRRAAWELEQQAARAAQIEREQIPVGGTRADGRDADRAREYQRAWRARP